MYPLLIEFGPISIYSYGVLLAAAYLIGLWFASVRAKNSGLDGTRVTDLGIYIIISALIGAKLLLIVVEFDHFVANPASFWTVLRSGGVFYGGLLLAIVVAFLYMRRHRLPFWTTCDAFAPGIALGQSIGRIGCLMAGCCYGKPSDLPWGFTFTNPLASSNVGTPLNVALHPTQLYESFAVLIILGLLLITEKRGFTFPGRTFWTYLLLYPVARFCIEFFRGDPRGMIFEFWSTSQFVSIMLIPISLIMLFRLYRSQAARIKTQSPRGT